MNELEKYHKKELQFVKDRLALENTGTLKIIFTYPDNSRTEVIGKTDITSNEAVERAIDEMFESLDIVKI